MAKFVKLDSGEYINIDMIITINNGIGETYYLCYTGVWFTMGCPPRRINKTWFRKNNGSE